ncbi:MAG: hypothetical protein J5825_10250, partial [Lachnospiraceae bacterium]|nr:hypothetical protein [Lachnospiraceae bacterium]
MKESKRSRNMAHKEEQGGSAKEAVKSLFSADVKGGIHPIEMVVFALVLFFCLLLFYQPDLVHTAHSSMAVFRGHIWDFYTYNHSIGMTDNYLPSTYWLFSVWCFFPHLFGWLPDVEGTLKTSFGSYLYYEMLPVTFYVLSAAVFCEIAKLLGFQMRRRSLLGYAALTVPLALYSQFIFCQYDIFTVFFVLLGIYFYL